MFLWVLLSVSRCVNVLCVLKLLFVCSSLNLKLMCVFLREGRLVCLNMGVCVIYGDNVKCCVVILLSVGIGLLLIVVWVVFCCLVDMMWWVVEWVDLYMWVGVVGGS